MQGDLIAAPPDVMRQHHRRCRCGGCGDFCGPDDGCPCEDCMALCAELDLASQMAAAGITAAPALSSAVQGDASHQTSSTADGTQGSSLMTGMFVSMQPVIYAAPGQHQAP